MSVVGGPGQSNGANRRRAHALLHTYIFHDWKSLIKTLDTITKHRKMTKKVSVLFQYLYYLFLLFA